MNFEQAFFDELVKIAAEAGTYLPGGAASKFLARARAGADAYEKSRHFLDRGAAKANDEYMAGQTEDWAKKQGRIPAPSEVTGVRRLAPLPDTRLPGAPSLPFSQRVRGMVGSIAGRVGFGMRTGVGRIGQGIRRAGRLLKVGGFRLPKIPKPKGGPLNPFAGATRLARRMAGSVTGTNVR